MSLKVFTRATGKFAGAIGLMAIYFFVMSWLASAAEKFFGTYWAAYGVLVSPILIVMWYIMYKKEEFDETINRIDEKLDNI